MYDIIYSPQAKDDLLTLQHSEPAAFRNAAALIEELKVHPRTGAGKPEPLSADRAGQWSRRISKKHRLVYEIFDTEVHVDVVSAYGHYGDK